MNCNTNSPKNLRLIDGTLAITVIREKYLNKEYTSAKIITREGFTYGRFEIRDALPKGKTLRPAIFMMADKFDGWAKNDQIDIMTNIQDNELGAGIHYSIPAQYEFNKIGYFSTHSNLNDFHTYSIEWNESEIKWFFLILFVAQSYIKTIIKQRRIDINYNTQKKSEKNEKCVSFYFNEFSTYTNNIL